jgi:hypothetical protein
MTIDPSTTAVVLIEYQNDFTTEGGVLHGAVEGVMNKTGMLDNTKRVLDAARETGATVMHAPITFAEGYNELSSHPYGILKGVIDGNAFVKDSWGAAIVDDLAPEPGDIVVEGKRGLDTFASTTSTSSCAAKASRPSSSAASSPTAASSPPCAPATSTATTSSLSMTAWPQPPSKNTTTRSATTSPCSPSR